MNYNTQISLKPSAPPGPRTLSPTLSKASPGLLIHIRGSGTDGGKHIKLFFKLQPQISPPLHLGRVTSRLCSVIYSCLTLTQLHASTYMLVRLLSIYFAVVLHSFMEINNFMLGLLYCNQCRSNSLWSCTVHDFYLKNLIISWAKIMNMNITQFFPVFHLELSSVKIL